MLRREAAEKTEERVNQFDNEELICLHRSHRNQLQQFFTVDVFVSLDFHVNGKLSCARGNIMVLPAYKFTPFFFLKRKD